MCVCVCVCLCVCACVYVCVCVSDTHIWVFFTEVVGVLEELNVQLLGDSAVRRARSGQHAVATCDETLRQELAKVTKTQHTNRELLLLLVLGLGLELKVKGLSGINGLHPQGCIDLRSGVVFECPS